MGSDQNLSDKVSLPEINKQNNTKIPINVTPKNKKQINF